jgi:hypothetical protein
MRAFVLGFVIAAVVAVVGCGGDGEEEKENFFAEGNRICADLDEKVEAVQRDTFKSLRSGEQASRRLYSRYAEKASPLVRAAFDDLMELSIPEGDEGDVRAIYRELNRGARMLEQAGRDPRAAEAFLVEEGEGPFARAGELTNEYGLVECDDQYNGVRD